MQVTNERERGGARDAKILEVLVGMIDKTATARWSWHEEGIKKHASSLLRAIAAPSTRGNCCSAAGTYLYQMYSKSNAEASKYGVQSPITAADTIMG